MTSIQNGLRFVRFPATERTFEGYYKPSRGIAMGGYRKALGGCQIALGGCRNFFDSFAAKLSDPQFLNHKKLKIS